MLPQDLINQIQAAKFQNKKPKVFYAGDAIWIISRTSKNIYSKEEALERHKLSLKTHIDTLAKKNYQGIKGIKTIDTVVMFCPNESAISIPSRQGGSELFEYAIKNKASYIAFGAFFTTRTKKVKHREIDNVKPGGLGTFFIQEIMDVVEFKDGKKPWINHLVLTKQL